jgi:hypothetical protein
LISFQQHQMHIPNALNFQLQFMLIFSEKIIQYLKTSTPQIETIWNQANHAPLFMESFWKTPRMEYEMPWFGIFHTDKQTKQIIFFIDKFPKSKHFILHFWYLWKAFDEKGCTSLVSWHLDLQCRSSWILNDFSLKLN